MSKNISIMKNISKKTAIRNGMHHLMEFLSEVELRIDEAERIKKTDNLEKIKDQQPVCIQDVRKSLELFLYQFLEASGKKLKINEISIYVDREGIGDGEIEKVTIHMGNIKLTLDSHDLYRYYGLMQILRKKQYTGKYFHFFLLGEERTITSSVALGMENKINVSELESTMDGRSLGEKLFMDNAIAAIKDDLKVTQLGSYQLKSTHNQVYIIKAYIGQEKGLHHLFELPPTLTKFHEMKIKPEGEFLIHHAEYRVPGVNFLNCSNDNEYYALNEVIRSFIINYGIAIGSYDAITRCYICGKIILPKKKSHRSFCSPKCRSINHKIEFGEDKFACFENQKQWFSYNLSLHGKDVYATIDTDNCKECERYWEYEKVPGGTCEVFIKQYGIENPKKEKWIQEEEIKLAKKIADQEEAFAEEFSKLKAQKSE